MTHIVLATVWLMIIALCLFMYAILDGFTLGVGVLFPWLTHHERDLAKSVILPTWDGNQTWLVMAAASLYGAFPLAFSALLPVMYIPLMLLVLGLLFRGVTFEFRLKAKNKRVWDYIFFLSSLLVTAIQGFLLGKIPQGFVFTAHSHVIHTHGGVLTPFSLFTALSLTIGYCLLGATRLIVKTEGHLQEKMYRYTYVLSFSLMAVILIASFWTPFLDPHVYQRWYGGTNWIYFFVLPYMTFIMFVVQIWSLYKREERIPFMTSLFLCLTPAIGFAISLYPYILPYRVPYWQAAAPQSTLTFLLVGAFLMLPLLVVYTGYSYHIFRGKVEDVLHY